MGSLCLEEFVCEPSRVQITLTLICHRFPSLKIPTFSLILPLKVFKVVSEDFEIFALKEVYLKHLDNAVKRAYVTEINFLKLLKNVPEVATLHFL